MADRRCKDCRSEGVTTARPTPHPGPRCVTHHRAKKARDKDRAHGRYVEQTYGITGEQYAQILEAQGGRCYICIRATGKARRLAVDHDHALAAVHGHMAPSRGRKGQIACHQCVRGLLCAVCNRLIGHFRDDPEGFQRAANYLRNWPAREVLFA